jgi:hypothetical protein
MNLTEIEKYYSISQSGKAGEPDTLRPKYGATFTIGFDYLKKKCGYLSGEDLCVPAWNCLNAKGRLVAPGGYVVSQSMRAGDKSYQVIKRIIVQK